MSFGNAMRLRKDIQNLSLKKRRHEKMKKLVSPYLLQIKVIISSQVDKGNYSIPFSLLFYELFHTKTNDSMQFSLYHKDVMEFLAKELGLNINENTMYSCNYQLSW